MGVSIKPRRRVSAGLRKQWARSRGDLKQIATGTAAEFRKHPIALGGFALLCFWVYPAATVRFLLLVGLVLVLAKFSVFWWWALGWKALLRKEERDIPPVKELWKTWKQVQKREEFLLKKWPELCVMNGLSTAKQKTPLLVDVKPTLELDFTGRIPRTGFDPDDIKAKASKIGKGLGCPSVVVKEPAPGLADIRFNWSDPLRRIYSLQDMPVASSDDKGEFGMEASSEAMSLDLDMATAYIGSPRSGKSITQDAWFCGRVDAGEWLNLYVSNPKTNEMRMFKKYLGQQMNRVKVVAYAEGEKPTPHVNLINRFEQDMNERNSKMAGKKLTKSTSENPRCALWLDEMLLLPKSVYKDKGDEFSPLRRILSGGPAAMFTVMGGTQLVYSEDFGAIKGLFTQRVVMRLPSPEIVDTAFFRGASSVAKCHLLHKTLDRGVGWALNDDGELTQFRSPKVEDADVERALRGLPTPGRVLDRTKEDAPEAKPDQSVYFIEAQGTDLVKIGIAASPKDRLRELQTASPHRLAILGTMPGGKPQESRFHRQFASSRAAGEWFHRTPELDALIADVQAGVFATPASGSHPMRHARQFAHAVVGQFTGPNSAGPDRLPWLN